MHSHSDKMLTVKKEMLSHSVFFIDIHLWDDHRESGWGRCRRLSLWGHIQGQVWQLHFWAHCWRYKRTASLIRETRSISLWSVSLCSIPSSWCLLYFVLQLHKRFSKPTFLRLSNDRESVCVSVCVSPSSVKAHVIIKSSFCLFTVIMLISTHTVMVS